MRIGGVFMEVEESLSSLKAGLDKKPGAVLAGWMYVQERFTAGLEVGN